ncbi:MAG TPA: DUF1007 family protein [Candidatus Sulfotelmatobacter sp.]|jgi:ABC-type uncharacterized transport system substrate-binding protein|nr:DUF1007 family protein [Candidatus Sulfotelmatobacter sp.]
MRRPVLSTLIMLLTPSLASAHPHVWVDTIVTARLDKGAVVSLREDWTFDEDFSATVLSDLRKLKGMGGDRHSAFSPAEIAKLQQNAFSNLKNYDYFTHLWLNDKALKIKPDVEDFTARMEGDKLRYLFTVRLVQPAAVKGAALKVGIWDDSYYVDVGPAKGQSALIEGDGTASCRARITDDPKHLLYYGSITPKIAEVTC